MFNNNLLTSTQSWGATTLSIIVNPYSVVIGIFLIIEPSPRGPSVLNDDRFGDEIYMLWYRLKSTMPVSNDVAGSLAV